MQESSATSSNASETGFFPPPSKNATFALAGDALPTPLVEPLPGLFARKSYWSELKPGRLTLSAAPEPAHKHPSWLFCSYSAACIHGLPVSLKLLDRIHLATEKDSQRDMDTLSGTSRSSANHALQAHRSQRLSKTVVDCARRRFPMGLRLRTPPPACLT